MNCKFSIIIPHKDTPELLQRMLDSIPLRDDLEVIIVDDNSNTKVVDFECFPGRSRPNTQIFFTKKGKGAGYARNVGIEHANGEWLIFADADDFFAERFENLLIEYYKSKADIIYIKHKDVLSDNILIERNRCHEFNDVMTNDWPKEEKELFFRCRHNVPWAKMVKKDLVDRCRLRYEEVKYSNDIVFNINAGCLANSVQLVNQCFYVLTEREGSLTSGNCQTIEELLQRAEAHIKMQAIIEQYGYYKESPVMWFLPTLYARNRKAFVSALRCCRKNKLSLNRLYLKMAKTIRIRERPFLLLMFVCSLFS